jgi:lipid-binding SYLF domain-containing protein
MTHLRRLVLVSLLSVLGAAPSAADTLGEARQTVSEARRVFERFVVDPDMAAFRSYLGSARAVLIIPRLGKGGVVLGMSAGNGVLLARDRHSGAWSQPAFYRMIAGSIGLQIGFQVAEVVLLAMTENGLDALLSTKLQLGADASIAAGPVGSGGQAATTDIVAFARAKGAFGGLTVEGGAISPDGERNAAYYRQPVSPADILIRRIVHNPEAEDLVLSVASGVGGR